MKQILSIATGEKSLPQAIYDEAHGAALEMKGTVSQTRQSPIEIEFALSPRFHPGPAVVVESCWRKEKEKQRHFFSILLYSILDNQKIAEFGTNDTETKIGVGEEGAQNMRYENAKQNGKTKQFQPKKKATAMLKT